MRDAQYWISNLGLSPHPEGGYYRETYHSSEHITASELTINYSGTRRLATSIYYLLPATEVSHFHRLIADEIWYYHTGESLCIYTISSDGKWSEIRLGLDLEAGERPFAIIPAGTVFGAVVQHQEGYSLVSCVVSPGFDFQDFELISASSLHKKYPEYEALITELTHA